MMEFDDIVVKESPGLCRCCLSEGCYKDLGSEYTWMNETEIYAGMLLDCFDIGISQHNDGPNGPKRLICEVCITRLRDACNFKKQVLDSEKKFVDMMGRGEFGQKVVIYQANMKAEELHEDLDVEEGEVQYLDDDMHFDEADDEPLRPHGEPSASDNILVASLKVKGKRGRPKKSTSIVKTEKKLKAPKLEEKQRTSKVSKGENQPVPEASVSLTTNKRNRLIKKNASLILEVSTVVPFKWHRQSYLCFYCNRPYNDAQLLKDHTQAEHAKPNIRGAVSYLRRDVKVKIDVTVIACRLCDTKLENINALIHHVKLKHNKTFAEDYGYGIVPYKLNNDSYQCAVCDEKFQYFVKLNQHMNEHFENYVCELCGKSFLSSDRLRCHTLCHGYGFRCNQCSETFDSLKRRNAHESKVHQINKTLKCFYCPETFATYNKRKKHHKAVHDVGIPDFLCPVCGKSFLVMSRMKTHFKEVHAKVKDFACTICDQKFFSRTLVRKHMIKHYGDRVHQCDVCKKSYPRKQTLRDHMRIHSDIKKFVCSLCSQGFVQNNSLRLHMRVHHPEPAS